MRVVIEKPPEGGEEELIVRVNQLSERVLELLRVIQAEDETDVLSRGREPECALSVIGVLF